MNFLKLSVTFVKSLSALFVPGKCPKRIDHEKIVAGESLASDSTAVPFANGLGAITLPYLEVEDTGTYTP